MRLSSTTPVLTRCAASSTTAAHGLDLNFPLNMVGIIHGASWTLCSTTSAAINYCISV